MACKICNDSQILLLCSNCGSIAKISFADDDIYEYCENCESIGDEYYIKEVQCPHCYLNNNSFEKHFDDVISKYKKDYGDIEYSKIKNKILNSNHVFDALNKYKLAQIPPSVDGIMKLLASSFFFLAGKKSKTAIGGSLFLYLWNKKCNENYKILSEESLVKLLLEFNAKSYEMLF
jgi:hypothetical protein